MGLAGHVSSDKWKPSLVTYLFSYPIDITFIQGTLFLLIMKKQGKMNMGSRKRFCLTEWRFCCWDIISQKKYSSTPTICWKFSRAFGIHPDPLIRDVVWWGLHLLVIAQLLFTYYKTIRFWNETSVPVTSPGPQMPFEKYNQGFIFRILQYCNILQWGAQTFAGSSCTYTPCHCQHKNWQQTLATFSSSTSSVWGLQLNQTRYPFSSPCQIWLILLLLLILFLVVVYNTQRD